jgi:uncharacterized membrane protein YfcA
MQMSLRTRALSTAAAIIGGVVLAVAGLIVLDHRMDQHEATELASAGVTAWDLSEKLAATRQESLHRRLTFLALGGSLAMVIGLALAWRLARRLEAPQGALREAAWALAAGRPLPGP